MRVPGFTSLCRHVLIGTCRFRPRGAYLEQRRWLTAAQTATALRPFFFAVHPDLFGQFPHERSVNEESIKKLNEYLDSIQRQQGAVQTTVVTFHVRDTSKYDPVTHTGRGPFKTVQVSLTGDLVASIRGLLKSCQIPLEYLNTVHSKNSTQSGPDRPIEWHNSFYEAFNRKNPNDTSPKKRRIPIVTLSSWLVKNFPKAKKQLEEVGPIRAAIERLTEQIVRDLGLKEVRWDSNWGYHQHRACLASFSRIYKQHRNHMQHLKGHTLSFSHETGVSVHGHIVLSSEDVPQHWMQVLKSVCSHDDVLSSLPGLETRLSECLNGIRVVRRDGPPILIAKHYQAMLVKVTRTLERYRADSDSGAWLGTASLEHLELLVDVPSGSLTLTQIGQILVPASCPGFLLIDFLNGNNLRAAALLQSHERNLIRVSSLMEQCREELALEAISRDESVSFEEMITCCERLLIDPRNLGMSIAGARLKVAKFYSVMSGGEIYIPWNWKGVMDED